MCPAVGDAERVGRRHTWVPPYRNAIKKSVRAVTPPYGSNCVENAQTRRRSGVFGCMYSFSGQHSGSWGITMAAMI